MASPAVPHGFKHHKYLLRAKEKRTTRKGFRRRSSQLHVTCREEAASDVGRLVSFGITLKAFRCTDKGPVT
jgi:hypothetical protein